MQDVRNVKASVLTTRTRPLEAVGDDERGQSLSQLFPGRVEAHHPLLASPASPACFWQTQYAREHPSAEPSIRPIRLRRVSVRHLLADTRAPRPSHSITFTPSRPFFRPRFPLERARHRQTVSRAPLRCVSKRHLSWLSQPARPTLIPLLTRSVLLSRSSHTSRCGLLRFVSFCSAFVSPRFSLAPLRLRPPTARHSFSRDATTPSPRRAPPPLHQQLVLLSQCDLLPVVLSKIAALRRLASPSPLPRIPRPRPEPLARR